MKTWFIADTHFGHDSYKGGIVNMMSRVKPGTNELFTSIDEHDNYLLSEINSVVDRHDRLIIAGDFAWDKPGYYRQQIKCKNVELVLGNHDKPTKCANVFSRVHQILTLAVMCQGFKQHVVVCHYPLAFWWKSYDKAVHLYGHQHGMVETRLDLLFPGRRSMDIGVDNIFNLTETYKPLVSDDIICIYLERRNGHDQIDYYHKYQETRHREHCQKRDIKQKSFPFEQ